MAETPRDPRQLARDILSGKISIEDLAREQRRRAEAAGKGGNAGNVGAKVGGAAAGLPRVAPPQGGFPRPVPAKPVARIMPAAQRLVGRPSLAPGRPLPRAPLGPPRPLERKGPLAPSVGNAGTAAAAPETARGTAMPPMQGLAPSPITAAQQGRAYQSVRILEDARRGAFASQQTVRALVQDRRTLRQAVLMAEILAKPLSLRDDAP